MVELSLSAAVVCGRDDDVGLCVVNELDEFISRSDCFQVCSTDHVRRFPTADPWMMLAVISSTDDSIPWYRVTAKETNNPVVNFIRYVKLCHLVKQCGMPDGVKGLTEIQGNNYNIRINSKGWLQYEKELLMQLLENHLA